MSFGRRIDEGERCVQVNNEIFVLTAVCVAFSGRQGGVSKVTGHPGINLSTSLLLKAVPSAWPSVEVGE